MVSIAKWQFTDIRLCDVTRPFLSFSAMARPVVEVRILVTLGETREYCGVCDETVVTATCTSCNATSE